MNTTFKQLIRLFCHQLHGFRENRHALPKIPEVENEKNHADNLLLPVGQRLRLS
jgi:hypothetical protein